MDRMTERTPGRTPRGGGLGAMVFGVLLLLLLLLAPMIAGAQPVRGGGWPWPRGTVGVMGGGALPVASLTDFGNPGWHAGIAWLSRAQVLGPSTLRVDASYADLGVKSEGVTTGAHVWTVNANLVFAALPDGGVGVRPYALVGGGVYYVDPRVAESAAGYTDEAREAKTTLGLNGGAGLAIDFGQFGLFTEARWHFIPGALRRGSTRDSDTAHLVPVTIGVRF